MMKIHTTQDLSVFNGQQLSTNSALQSELRFGKNSIQQKNTADVVAVNTDDAESRRKHKNINVAVWTGIAVAATGIGISRARKAKADKSVTVSDLKNTIKKVKENVTVGDIKEKSNPPITKWEKFLTGKFFDKVLKFSENEPVMQSIMSAFICILLRPATIMALPSKNGKSDKENNMYASAHSMSSGVMGLISTIFIAQPFKSGAKYTMEYLRKDMKEDALKRLYPQLDIESIYEDAAHTVRKDVKFWKFTDGKKFMSNFKDVDKIPDLKSFNEISDETYKKILGVDVDWASQKGKLFNEVMTRDGKRLYDVINWNNLGLIVEQKYVGSEKISKKMQEECSKKAKVLLQDMDREFLEKVIKDEDAGSAWKKLDLNSVFDKNGKVVDFRQWKELGTDNQWKLELGNTYVSSALDTLKYTPRVSGRHRIEPNGEIKYAAYLKNGNDGELGSIVDEAMAEVDKKNEVYDKMLTWAPDILTRPLIATATIALIPIALKNIFHLEKKKTSEPVKEIEKTVQEQKTNDVESANNDVSFKGVKNNAGFVKDNDDTASNTANSNNISFKAGNHNGRNHSKIRQWFREAYEKYVIKKLANVYGKRIYESENINKLAYKLSKFPGSMTSHMATLGAFLTSSVYMYQTLNKKNLDDDKKRTLAVNQGLCFVIPTICAYTVDKLLNNWTKKRIEYVYSGAKEYEIAKLKLDPSRAAEVENLQKDLGQKLKGVRTLISLAIFTMIYRYIAPVLITPAANRLGDKINENRKLKAAAEAESAKTVKMTNDAQSPEKINENRKQKTAVEAESAKTVKMTNDAQSPEKIHSAA